MTICWQERNSSSTSSFPIMSLYLPAHHASVIHVVTFNILCHESSAWIYGSSGIQGHSGTSQETNLYQHCCDNHKSHSFSLLRAENFNLKCPILNLLGIQRNVDEGTEITIIKYLQPFIYSMCTGLLHAACLTCRNFSVPKSLRLSVSRHISL